jgi:hypothetical protein
MANTQSQRRSQKKGGLGPLLAIEQSVSAPVLCSRKVMTGRQKVCAHFFLTTLGSR